MPTSSRKTVNAGPTPDAICIVPLHFPDYARQALGLAPTAQLTYRNGPLLTAVEVFTIFWGAAWQKAPAKTLVGQLNAFFDFILTSVLIDQLGEYNIGTKKITHGRRTGTATIATPAPQLSVTDNTIRQFLRQKIANGTVPKPKANTLYFLYVPPGVRVVMGGSASCQSFCG